MGGPLTTRTRKTKRSDPVDSLWTLLTGHPAGSSPGKSARGSGRSPETKTGLALRWQSLEGWGGLDWWLVIWSPVVVWLRRGFPFTLYKKPGFKPRHQLGGT